MNGAAAHSAGISSGLSFALSFGAFALSLLLAPLLSGIINRIKARVGGRQGRPLPQLYYDLAKLLRKAPVYPEATTFIFRMAGPIGVGAGVLALCFVPFGMLSPLLGFPGDFALLAGIFALARFALILAALDTGSAFEGMGAAREALFSALAEPIFLFCMLMLANQVERLSLGEMLGGIADQACLTEWHFYLMISIAMFLLLLLENCRIPVDDPNTHLELTMIHEVMILDHSGPDLALLEYAAALKLWTFCLLISGILVPAGVGALCEAGVDWLRGGQAAVLFSIALGFCIIFLTAAVVGFIESVMARFRMERVPQVLTLAGSFTCLAALVVWS